MSKYAFGVDVGGTTCKIGLFSEEGCLVDKWEIKTDTSDNGANILQDIANTVKNIINEKKIADKDIAGIGMGIPGPVLKDGTVNKCVNLGWGVFNIEKAMKDLTGFDVKAGNDANVAALGEVWKGAARNYSDSIMVTLGTGVGGGIVINNNILTGAFGAAGEIGHIKVKEFDVEKCGCGNSGCLEQYASATGIVRLANEYLESTKEETSLRKATEISAKTVFDAAKKGDKMALRILDEVANILGTVLANLASTVNPEIIVIGGGVSKAGSILIDPIKEYFQLKCFHACSKTEITLAILGNDAGMFGAGKLILN